MSENKPYTVGQVLITPWSKAKTARNRVVKVTKVIEKGNGDYKYYYYDLLYPNGETIRSSSSNNYVSFEEYREKIQGRIHNITKTLYNFEEEYKASIKLEADGKKLLQR